MASVEKVLSNKTYITTPKIKHKGMPMLKNLTRAILTILLLIILLIFSQTISIAYSNSVEFVNEEQIVVVAVIEQLASIVREVGGAKVKVETIIPPNVDPHHYEPPLDTVVKTLSRARIVVTTASYHFPVEDKIYQMVSEGLIKVKIIGLLDYQKNGLRLLINPKTNDFNIHGFYLSVNGLKAIASAIAEELVNTDPDNRQYYSEKLNNYLQNLDRIEKTIKSFLSDREDIEVFLYTPLLQYVAEDLGLKRVRIVVSELDVEPSEKDISEMLRSLRSGEADYIIISDVEALENPKLLELVIRQGLPYVVIPLSKFTETPQLVSLSTAVLVSSHLSSGAESSASSSYYNFLLIFSFIANIIFLVIIILLVIKAKKHGE